MADAIFDFFEQLFDVTDEEICECITELEKTSTSLTTTDNNVNNDAKLDDAYVTQVI
jgi:hypothetical protein